MLASASLNFLKNFFTFFIIKSPFNLVTQKLFYPKNMFYNTKIRPIRIPYTEKRRKNMFYSIFIDLHQ